MAGISRTLTGNVSSPIENGGKPRDGEHPASNRTAHDTLNSFNDAFATRYGRGPTSQSKLGAADTEPTSDTDAFGELVAVLALEMLGGNEITNPVTTPTTTAAKTNGGTYANATNGTSDYLDVPANSNPPVQQTSDGGQITWGIDSQLLGDDALTGDVSRSGLVNGAIAQTDPQVDFGDDVTYQPISSDDYVQSHGASLFGDKGPSANDVLQGKNGDCYFMATAASLANTDPQALRDMMQDNNDGTYNVTLYYQGKPETVRVDDDVPTDSDGNAAYAQYNVDNATGKAVIWPMILEKAFAKFSDRHPDVLDTTSKGYEALNNGGYGAEAMAALTGKAVYSNNPKNLTTGALDDMLNSATQGKSVTLGTLNSDSDTYTKNGLLTGHMYTVLGTVKGSDGRQWVKLRDPWGFEPSVPGAKNGVIYLPVSVVAQNCDSVVVGQQALSNEAQGGNGVSSGVDTYTSGDKARARYNT